jgi:hypothetical protein
MQADPFDPDAQAKIAEAIRMQNVMQNLETAMEHNPEVFGRVSKGSAAHVSSTNCYFVCVIRSICFM